MDVGGEFLCGTWRVNDRGECLFPNASDMVVGPCGVSSGYGHKGTHMRIVDHEGLPIKILAKSFPIPAVVILFL